MKFGTYYAYWEREWDADYNFYCKKVSNLGFDILEVAAGGLVEKSDAELERLKNTAIEHNLTLTACIGLPAKYNVSSSDASVRAEGLAYLSRILQTMDKVDARLLGGIIYAYWPCDYSQPVDKPAAWGHAVESMQALSQSAIDLGITLVMETVNRFEQYIINSAAEAVQFVKDIDRKNAKVMLDCFHMNIEEDNIAAAIRQTGDYLGHFHIGECNRKVPGKGSMPWNEMGQALRDIGYNGTVVMEPFVKPGGTVGSDIKVWRDLSEGADEKQLDDDIRNALLFVKKKFLA